MKAARGGAHAAGPTLERLAAARAARSATSFRSRDYVAEPTPLDAPAAQRGADRAGPPPPSEYPLDTTSGSRTSSPGGW